MATILTPEGFQAATNVSRETLTRLELYAELLHRWQKAVNLVAASTIKDLWRRHMLDSAQLFPFISNRPCRLLDLGSGAGFPGLVLAIMGAGLVTLVESDLRKAAFLREAIRVTEADAKVHAKRIESLAPMVCDVVMARALAPVAQLLNYAVPHLNPGGICLFLKGERVEEELTQAANGWKMRVERFPSMTDPGGCIVRLGEIASV